MSTAKLFQQNVIALVWDFDKTLIRTYMQEPLFKKYNIDPVKFWREVEALPTLYAQKGVTINPETSYLNHLLTYVRQGLLPGLSNQALRECGQLLDFFDGLPDFFEQSKNSITQNPAYADFDIKVEHYIISGGLTEIIKGSKVAPYVDGIWACEFTENFFDLEKQTLTDSPGTITDIGYTIDNTTKTRALFEINKGANKFPEQISVNQRMGTEQRRVPFANMIYIADGPSDIPAFSVVNRFGGRTLAVYSRNDIRSFRQAKKLLEDARVHLFSEADYTAGSQTYLWLTEQITECANRIVKQKSDKLAEGRNNIPKHI